MVNYTQLNISLRKLISYKFNIEQKSMRKIAKELNVSPNTISLEIRRNKVKAAADSIIDIKYDNKQLQLIDGKYIYEPKYAQINAEKKLQIVRCQKKIIKGNALYNKIESYLKKGYKPDAIAGRLKYENPDDETYHVSHEAIYCYIYMHHKNEWYQYLKKSRKTRKTQSKRQKHVMKNHSSIHNRCDEADNRIEIGHLEGDSIIGETGGSKRIINTLVDRMSRKMFAVFAPDKTAPNTYEAIKSSIDPISNLIKTITYDNGSEFTDHYKLMKEYKITSHFADPYSSWQRGTNERHNGLIRRFFPKKKNFDNITDQELQEVVDFWNNYPRKILGYRTPNEVWDEEVIKISKLERRV